MAITFDKDLDSAKLNPIHNNNVVEFHSDIDNETHCIIEVEGKEYKIYPSASSVFWYNFKHLFKKLLYGFDDGIHPKLLYAVDRMTQPDTTLFKELSITYTIYSDTESDTVTKNVILLNNVIDYKLQVLDDELTKITNKVCHYAGYPTCVTFWASVTDDNYHTVRARDSVDGKIWRGINRLFVDDGTLTDVVSEMSVTLGSDAIEWEVKEYDCEGVLLKWYTRGGGWHYHLFNKRHQETTTGKDTYRIDNDFESATDIVSPSVSAGRDQGQIKKLYSLANEQFEIDILNSIIGSPKVLIYTGTRGAQATVDDWLEVKLKTNRLITENYKGHKLNTSIEIEIPQTQMQL